MFRFYPEETADSISWKFIGTLHDDYREQFRLFNSKYKLASVLVNIPYLIKPLKKKKERKCLFCGLSYPEVRFNKVAHVIPELIGNKTLLSDFECDNCNEIFSRYENDFAYSLGLTRSFLQVNSKNGTPTFKSPDKSLVVKEGFLNKDDTQKKVVFESHGKKNDNFKVDADNKTLQIRTKKHSYVPFHIFKMLLKIGISAVQYDAEAEMEKFQPALDLLINKVDIQTSGSSVFSAFVYNIPGFTFPSPMVLLFKKINSTDAMFTYTACLYFMDSIYQIFLPGYKDDMWMYDGKQKIDCMVSPPFLDKTFIEKFGFPNFRRMDLDSKELVKGEDSVINFNFDSHKYLTGDTDSSI